MNEFPNNKLNIETNNVKIETIKPIKYDIPYIHCFNVDFLAFYSNN